MTAPTHTCAPNGTAASLVALDIDGTLTSEGSIEVPERTTEAVTSVRAEGHDVVLASGRSLAGILPVAAWLGLSGAYAVASNGAVTARLNQAAPGGYELVSVKTFDAGPIIALARQHMPSVRVAVEEVGVGYQVSARFPMGTLNGRQKWLPDIDLMSTDTTRLVLRAPGAVDVLLERLRALDVTAHAGAGDSIDVTPPGLSKATALERVRHRLGVASSRVVVVGDGTNDTDMFAWARAGGGRAAAMGHASAAVREAAGEVTGDLAAEGVVAVLDSLLVTRQPVLGAAR